MHAPVRNALVCCLVALLASKLAGCAATQETAAATVDRFQAALVAGDLEAASNLLDPDVVILESGGAELSRAEYLAVHAKSDAEFLSRARIEPRHRSTRVVGELAWVASLAEMTVEQDGGPLVIEGAESMVLRRGAGGWRIVHIHWSSRARK